MVDKILQGALEDNILTMLCWSELHCANISMQVEPKLFSTRAYRDIAAVAIGHIERYSVPPKEHLRDLLETDLRKGDEGKILWKTLDAMEALQSKMQPDYVLGELSRFIATRQLSLAVEAAADRLHNGELEEAREALFAVNAPASAGKGVWLHKPEEALEFMIERDEDTFSSGISTLDDMDITPARKELMILIAPAKKGKTWFLIGVGKAGLIHGNNVLHITLENGEKKTAMRYIQALYAMTVKKAETIRIPLFRRDEANRCTSIDFDTINPDVLDAGSRTKLKKKLPKLRGRLKIKEFPTGALSLAQLNSYLDHLARVEDFVPDVILLDYPDLMKIEAANLRIDTGRLFQGLRGIAVARNLAMVAVTQGNRVSATSKTVGSHQVAEDYSKIGTADTVLTYSQTSEEKGCNLARILVSEARNAKDKFLVLISQSYASGQFCLDSVYMQKHIEAEVSRLTGGDAPEED